MKCNLYLCIHAFYLFFKVVVGSSAECKDLNGRVITQDMHYVPGPDSCTLCICDNGHPKWCKAVLCSPPQNCKSFSVGKSCCEFICLDDTLNKGDGIADFGADFGLRLIVSAIAAILSLCLLFFLVHRLRQRKIRGRQNRQLSEDERSLASIGYITGSLGYLPQNYFSGGGPERHLEFRYEEPPSHLSLWKPSGNYFPRGEAPPPYEEAVSQPRNEVTISTSNTLPNMSHRTIPINLTTTGTIRLLNPSTAPSSLRNNESVCSSQNNLEIGSRSHSNSNIVQTLDHNRVCLLENPNGYRHSIINRNSNNPIKSDENPLNRTDFNANTVIRNTVPLPRNTVKQINPTNIVNLRQNLEIDKKLTSFNSGANIHADINLNASSDASTLRYEININSAGHLNDEGLCTLRKDGNRIHSSNCNSVTEAPKNGKTNLDLGKLNEPQGGESSESKNAVPPLGRLLSNVDSAIGSDVLYEDVVALIPPVSPPENIFFQKLEVNLENTMKKNDDEEKDKEEDLDVSTISDFPPPPLLEDNSLTEPDVDNELSSCDCSCYQYLSNNDDNDDYRSECENCKSGHSSSYYLDEESHEPPETMTLQRVPKETDEFENQEQYYRTSLTLPTHCKKTRVLQSSSTARENWFSSMPESGSSSEEE